MAIRPVDIQGVIAQSAQTAPLARQGEEAQRVAQNAAQNQFVNKLEERTETVHESEHGRGNKVNPEGNREQPNLGGRKKRKRQPGEPFDELIVDGGVISASEDGEHHIIDFSA